MSSSAVGGATANEAAALAIFVQESRQQLDKALEVIGWSVRDLWAVPDVMQFATCPFDSSHRVPDKRLVAHGLRCHGQRPESPPQETHEFFYRHAPNVTQHKLQSQLGSAREILANPLIASLSVSTAQPQYQSSATSLVSEVDITQLPRNSHVATAIVQAWARIPKSYETLDMSTLEIKPTTEWLTQLMTSIGCEADADLVDFIVGLLWAGEASSPDTLVSSIEEFVGFDMARTLALALWKHLVLQSHNKQLLADQSTFAAARPASAAPRLTPDAALALRLEQQDDFKRRPTSYRPRQAALRRVQVTRQILVEMMQDLGVPAEQACTGVVVSTSESSLPASSSFDIERVQRHLQRPLDARAAGLSLQCDQGRAGCDISPVGRQGVRERSPVGLHQRSGGRESSPVGRHKRSDRSLERREWSPLGLRRSLERRERSPERHRQSPERHRQSPDRRHRQSPDRLHRRSPGRRRQRPERHRPSPDRRRQSPERHRRSQDRQHQSPERHRQSPDRRHRRSPDRRHQSSDRQSRSPIRRR